MFHGRISLNSVLLLLLVNFVSGFRLELMYISLIENISLSVTHLHGFQLLVSSDSKVKFRQASKCCKRVLEAAKFDYTNKTRVHHFPETWLSELLRIANVLNKGKSATHPLLNGPEVLPSASDKAKLFAENFSKSLSFSDIDDSSISLPVFPLQLI